MKTKIYDRYDKSIDTVETEGLLPIIEEFLESITLPFEANTTHIENFEYQSRDGFAASSHNRGGMDLLAITTAAHLIASGEHFGTQIELDVENYWSETFDEIQKENPELTDEQVFDETYTACNDDYSGEAWRVRVMYEGGNTLVVYAGYDKDAPYYRWHCKNKFEHKIVFKNKTDLKKQLTKLVKKVEASQ